MDSSQNCIMRISDQKTKKLIELYHEQECLWNTLSEDYKNRLKRVKAAEQIAEKLKIPNFKAKHVMMKFKNLRNSYCQELKKITHSLSDSPNGEGAVYKPKVFWFPLMEFIRPHLQPVRFFSNWHLKTLEPALEELQVKREVEDSDPDGDAATSVEMGSETMEKETFVNIELSENDECLWEIENRIPRKRAKVSKQEDQSQEPQLTSEFAELAKAFRETVAHLQLVKVQNELKESKEDHYDSFGRYVASMLRKLPEQKSMRLQPQIINMIISADLETTKESTSQIQ